MTAISRNAAVKLLTELAWGSHLCVFYDTKRDLLDILVPYFAAGLEKKQLCLWVLAEGLSPEEATIAMGSSVEQFDRHVSQGDMQFVTHEQWFYTAGRLDLHTVIGRFEERCREAVSRGYAGMRFEGSSAWLAMKQAKQFTEFEGQLDGLVAGKRMIVLCSFPIANSGAEQLLGAASTHQFAIVRRQGEWEIVETQKAHNVRATLTRREQEIFTWIAQGRSASDIAKLLCISKRTVDAHSQNVVQKLGAANRTQAVAIALRDGLIKLHSA